MAQKSSVIKCQKCGYVSNIISDTCVKCGSKLEKVCGECGFGNAVEKNYCDQCGGLLALRVRAPGSQRRSRPGPAVSGPKASWRTFDLTSKGVPAPNVPGDPVKPPSPPKLEEKAAVKPPEKPGSRLEIEPILDAMAARYASFRSRGPKPPQKPPIQTAGPAEESSPARTPIFVHRSEAGDQPPKRGYRAVYSVLMRAGLAAGLIFIGYRAAVPHIPRLALKEAARGYLGDLAAGRYERVYERLSVNSKAACSIEEYAAYNRRYYSGRPAWEFAGVEIAAMRPEAAVIKYRLHEGSAPWRADYITFLRENDKWTHPYTRIFFEPIKSALAGRDYAQALFLAQKLYLTDPMDPRTSGYLCLSEFYMGLYDKSAESCGRAVGSAKTYPAGVSRDELFQYGLYYADSLRLTGKPAAALTEYEGLSASDDLSMKERCPLHMNRADAYVRLGKYEPALNDMLKADSVCFGEADRAEIARRLRFMNGEALAEAVVFAKSSRSRADKPSFGEIRRETLEKFAASPGPGGVKNIVTDNWSAEHLAGPEYRVDLRQESLDPRTRLKETREIYAFVVNLWTGVIRRDQPVPAE